MRYEKETREEISKLPHGTVSEASMTLGMREEEPLLVAMNAMLRYAKAYRGRFDCVIADDGFIADPYFQVIKGLKALLNGDGAVAMERNITTDSKDNGVIESLYWHCCNKAGLNGDE